MDIKRAKREIQDAIEAYLMKDADGEYMIPSIRQRPILLMGPPGIGKTQIMEQIAKECGINLVAYTITHHTRQSAVGLPFIKEKTYGGETYSVTEYTMSEIIASVYDKIEKTKIPEGILFIDEINCVSETLAPTMLQFLQCKTFGNQKVPDGWIIAAAGNPPEYNKSVREFDVVTLDRIKKIDVEENFEVWKEYAYKAAVHPAIIAYLELKKENFYRMETTVDGKRFATARGWEDLSELIKVYEILGKTIDREIVYQYIKHWKIAKDFANYLELYAKYRKDYGLEKILDGVYTSDTLERLKFAAFDERLSVIGLLTGKLSELFRNAYDTDNYVTDLFGWLRTYRAGMAAFADTVKHAEQKYEALRRAEQMTKAEDKTAKRVCRALESYEQKIREEHVEGEAVFAFVKEMFEEEASKREEEIERVSRALDNAFIFMEQAFGESQEMVVFITELNTNYYSIRFINENGCDYYYRYHKGMLFEEKREEILKELDQIEAAVSEK